MSETQAAIETTAAAVTGKTTWAGAVGGVTGLAMSLDWLTIVGVLVAIASFIVNVYFQHKRNKREECESKLRTQREQVEHNLRVEHLKDKCNVKQD